MERRRPDGTAFKLKSAGFQFGGFAVGTTAFRKLDLIGYE
jgi:hypothetical protein